MESLLRWSIENSGKDGEAAANGAGQPVQRKDLDPGIIDAILGKPDAELMKEDLSVALDKDLSEDKRVNALDDFEMLVEQIDNANNIEKLGMWPPIQSLLTDSNTPKSVLLQAIWVVGTALQNNPAAQEAYLKLDPLPILASFLEPAASTSQIRSKVLYALSGLLKHFAPAVKALDEPEADGWVKLKGALQDPDIAIRRKAAFLLNTLLIPNEQDTSSSSPSSQSATIHSNSHASHLKDPSIAATSPLTVEAMKKHAITDAVIESLVNPVPYGDDGDQDEVDEDFEGRCISLLRTFTIDCKAPLDQEQRVKLAEFFGSKGAGRIELAERCGLSPDELKEFIHALSW